MQRVFIRAKNLARNPTVSTPFPPLPGHSESGFTDHLHGYQASKVPVSRCSRVYPRPLLLANLQKLPKPPKRKIVSILWTITFAELLATAIVGFVYIGTNDDRPVDNAKLRLPVGLILLVSFLNLLNPFFRAFMIAPRTYAIIVFVQLSLALPAGLLTLITTFKQPSEELQSQCISVFAFDPITRICAHTTAFKWLAFVFVFVTWIITTGLLHRALLKVPPPREKEGNLLPLRLRQGSYERIVTNDNSVRTGTPRHGGEIGDDGRMDLAPLSRDDRNEQCSNTNGDGKQRNSSDVEADYAEAEEPAGIGLGTGAGALYYRPDPGFNRGDSPQYQYHNEHSSSEGSTSSRSLSRSSLSTSMRTVETLDSHYPLVEEGSSDSLASLVPRSLSRSPRPMRDSSRTRRFIPDAAERRSPSPVRPRSQVESMWTLDTHSRLLDQRQYNLQSTSTEDDDWGQEPEEALGSSKFKESLPAYTPTTRGQIGATQSVSLNSWVEFDVEEDEEDDGDMGTMIWRMR